MYTVVVLCEAPRHVMLMGVEIYIHTLLALVLIGTAIIMPRRLHLLGKNPRYPLNRRRGGLQMWCGITDMLFNPLNPELNPICYLLALLGVHHFLHVSRIRVNH